MSLSGKNQKHIRKAILDSSNYAIYFLVIVVLLIFSCTTPRNAMASSNTSQKEEPVRIANDSLEYEIIIFDIGFNYYLQSIARPISYYSQDYLETRNRIYVIEWNNRVRDPLRYNHNIYENIIDYQPTIDYGLEVNYKLFNYFQFAQRKYKMRLGYFRAQ